MKKRRIKKKVLNFILGSGITILTILIYILIFSEEINRSVKVEAGMVITPELFCKVKTDDIEYAKDCPPFYPDKPGTYAIKVKRGLFEYDCNLVIEDTRPPVAKSINVELPYGQKVTPYDFVSEVYDATDIDAIFLKGPDMMKMGRQQVTVQLTDTSGNKNMVTSYLNVVPVKPFLCLEAGSEPITPESLVCNGNYEDVSGGFQDIDFDHVGDYYIHVYANGETYPCHISIVDTSAPVIAVNEIHFAKGIERSNEDYAKYIEDNTNLDIKLSYTPDYMSDVNTYIVITAVDEGGNVTEKNVHVFVEEDVEPPTFVDTVDFTIFTDEAIAYRKYVHLDDNSGVEVSLSIDSSKVNASVVGDYPVIYTATDYAGNVATKEVTVSVIDRIYTDEYLNEKIDELLAQIITDDMDETARARAVYDWVKNNIEYTGTSDKHNFNKAAINGLLDFKGDCFTNTAICVACFERMGMKAKVIRKDPIVTMFNHWWLIVNINGNYYHMDTCPRTRDNPEIFLWTDSKLQAYSESHLETHHYDRSKYPHVKRH